MCVSHRVCCGRVSSGSFGGDRSHMGMNRLTTLTEFHNKGNLQFLRHTKCASRVASFRGPHRRSPVSCASCGRGMAGTLSSRTSLRSWRRSGRELRRRQAMPAPPFQRPRPSRRSTASSSCKTSCQTLRPPGMVIPFDCGHAAWRVSSCCAILQATLGSRGCGHAQVRVWPSDHQLVCDGAARPGGCAPLEGRLVAAWRGCSLTCVRRCVCRATSSPPS